MLEPQQLQVWLALHWSSLSQSAALPINVPAQALQLIAEYVLVYVYVMRPLRKQSATVSAILTGELLSVRQG